MWDKVPFGFSQQSRCLCELTAGFSLFQRLRGCSLSCRELFELKATAFFYTANSFYGVNARTVVCMNCGSLLKKPPLRHIPRLSLLVLNGDLYFMLAAAPLTVQAV